MQTPLHVIKSKRQIFVEYNNDLELIIRACLLCPQFVQYGDNQFSSAVE